MPTPGPSARRNLSEPVLPRLKYASPNVIPGDGAKLTRLIGAGVFGAGGLLGAGGNASEWVTAFRCTNSSEGPHTTFVPNFLTSISKTAGMPTVAPSAPFASIVT